MKFATLLAGAALAIAASQAHAFCVYNKIDKDFHAMVRSGGSLVDPKTYKHFTMTVKPGKSECCNWKNGDCNHSKKREAMLSMSQYNTTYNGRMVQCRSFSNSAGSIVSGNNLQEPGIQAGGYVTLENNPQFNRGKQATADNAPYLHKSWSYDDKFLGQKPCSE